MSRSCTCPPLPQEGGEFSMTTGGDYWVTADSITEDGRKVLLNLAPGTKEDTASCTAFFEDLKRRGLADPLLAVTDGAPGLIRAVETCFPRALRQRCLVHRMRNLRSKAPESQWPEIALRARGCYEAASPALATVLRDDFVAAYE